MDKAERHMVTIEWNNTASPFPSDKCVHELFETQAIRTPDAVAIVCNQDEVTYAELDARAGAVACKLKDLAVGPNTLVGLLVERSIEMIVGLMGILKAGGAFVPIDPAYPASRIQLYLEDSGAAVLVTTQECLDNTEGVDKLVHVQVDAPEFGHSAWAQGHLPTGHEARVESSVRPEDLCYVIYTSGSTGRPKGVLLRHKGWNNIIDWTVRDLKLEAGMSWLCVTTIAFDIAIDIDTGTPAPTISSMSPASSRDPSPGGSEGSPNRLVVSDLSPGGSEGSPNRLVVSDPSSLSPPWSSRPMPPPSPGHRPLCAPPLDGNAPAIQIDSSDGEPTAKASAPAPDHERGCPPPCTSHLSPTPSLPLPPPPPDHAAPPPPPLPRPPSRTDCRAA